ncbi:hypothetical protein B0T22DRAFT_368800 [Podospora appendiculata]|uniref:DNA mismatch repair protein S5 domain-containing protein n=1 Tax=Podospora appendiculata TaxID=314037 RepID=A0AAE1CID5_9PEZI|nr:hypothetical protein B0T22DRAFT_368800 [Podospora appendiculata]
MPISALSEDSIRHLGSTIAISTPVTLVKELLDNALDSGATSVDVLVSPNTVNKIEVMDNGSGIHPDDFDSLGRPGHTSKLRTFDELSSLGGSSLGFRGVALASTIAIAAQVSITTRIATEPVATALCFSREGGIARHTHKSALAGTTVCVTGLFSRLPVRSQAVIKESKKTLLRVKELLQAYALARPRVRLHFRVFYSPNMSWSFSPLPNTNVEQAVMQVFGAELVSQCMFKCFPDTGRDAQAGGFEEGIVFEAFLPKPMADAQKVSKGSFFCVDSRPLSSKHGTAKKLHVIFKSYLGRSISMSGSDGAVRDPFIHLNIRCVPGSYDPNIEPSKDDVLFGDEQQILGQFEKFISIVYPASGDSLNGRPTDSLMDTSTNPGIRTDCAPPDSSHQVTSSDEQEEPSSQTWAVDMSAGIDRFSEDEDDAVLLVPSHRTTEDAPDTVGADFEHANPENPLEGLNPWSIAKLAAPRTVNRHSAVQAAYGPPNKPQLLPSNSSDSSDGVSNSVEPIEPVNRQHTLGPSAMQSSANFRQKVPRGTYRRPLPASRPASTPSSMPDVGSASPPNPSRRNLGPRGPPLSTLKNGSARMGENLNAPSHGNHIRLSRTRPLLNRSGNQKQKQQQKNRASHDRLSSDMLNMIEGDRDSVPEHYRQARLRDYVMMVNDMNTTNMERNREPAELPIQNPFLGLTSPAGGLESGGGEPADCGSIRREELPHEHLAEDSRRYLIRRQRSMVRDSRKKLRRLRTDLLPLETIPRGFETYTLMLTMEADSCHLVKQLVDVSRFDKYLKDGQLPSGLESSAEGEAAALEARVRALLSQIGCDGPGQLQLDMPRALGLHKLS